MPTTTVMMTTNANSNACVNLVPGTLMADLARNRHGTAMRFDDDDDDDDDDKDDEDSDDDGDDDDDNDISDNDGNAASSLSL